MADHDKRLTYLKGCEDSFERARKIVEQTCEKRTKEMYETLSKDDARRVGADIAFTRDRILAELEKVAEWVAAERTHHEREQAKRDEKDGMPMSQHCRVMDDHAHCPGENTLGTSRCKCPCHGSGS